MLSFANGEHFGRNRSIVPRNIEIPSAVVGNLRPTERMVVRWPSVFEKEVPPSPGLRLPDADSYGPREQSERRARSSLPAAVSGDE